MGNVNGRDDVNGTPSETEGEEEDDDEAAAVAPAHGVADCMSANPGYRAPSDMMGHSPPASPRTTQSPFMFAPQVPVVPLQRPDEMHTPSPSWMQTTSGYEDMYSELGIPTMITWSYDGKEVAVEGSWDNWKTRMSLQRSGKDFTIMKVLPSGVYQFRFIVDGQWRYAPDLPWAQDDAGNAYNILDLQVIDIFSCKSFVFNGYDPELISMSLCGYVTLQDYVPEDIGSISSFEPPKSPDSSYNNLQLSSEDYAKEPPLVPPYLQMTLLNIPSTNMEIQPLTARPQHVVLNHLYMQKGKGSPSVVALGTTHRFLAKYVTVVLYKSLQR